MVAMFPTSGCRSRVPYGGDDAPLRIGIEVVLDEHSMASEVTEAFDADLEGGWHRAVQSDACLVLLYDRSTCAAQRRQVSSPGEGRTSSKLGR